MSSGQPGPVPSEHGGVGFAQERPHPATERQAFLERAAAYRQASPIIWPMARRAQPRLARRAYVRLSAAGRDVLLVEAETTIA